MTIAACGGPPKVASPDLAPDAGVAAPSVASAPSASDAPATASSDATAAAGPAPAASAAPADAGPPAKPFAENAEQATSLIDDAISSRSNDLLTCVNDSHARKKDIHAKIVVEVGIDQEGHLLGVKMPKGAKPDRPLAECFMNALRGAPFPRSHSGVITVRRTFEDKAVVR
jgi:hypothetical protein